MKRSQLERKPMKRSPPKRDWSAARAKCDREGVCRFDPTGRTCEGKMEAAHILGRELDRKPATLLGEVLNGLSNRWVVYAVRVVPACTTHHRAYDAHELDLLPYLTVEEQAQAVLDAGGLELARNRICGL